MEILPPKNGGYHGLIPPDTLWRQDFLVERGDWWSLIEHVSVEAKLNDGLEIGEQPRHASIASTNFNSRTSHLWRKYVFLEESVVERDKLNPRTT
jgi:hypothetical protein